MAALFKTIFPCLPFERGIQLPTKPEKYQRISEKASLQPSVFSNEKCELSDTDFRAAVWHTVMDANDFDHDFHAKIDSLVRQAGGWSEFRVASIRLVMEAIVRGGKPMNAVLQQAYDKACEAAKIFEEFAAEHPVATAVFCTVIALGVLVILMPWVVEALGFSELGPIEGGHALLCLNLSVIRCLMLLQVLGQHCGNLRIEAKCRRSHYFLTFRGSA